MSVLQLPLADLLRQSVYSRLAGYEDVNDAERLSQDPTFRLIGSAKIWERGVSPCLMASSTSPHENLASSRKSTLRPTSPERKTRCLRGAPAGGKPGCSGFAQAIPCSS